MMDIMFTFTNDIDISGIRYLSPFIYNSRKFFLIELNHN